MASTQELDTRVSVIEDKLDFIMKNMQGRVVVPSGVVDASGKELPPKTHAMNMLDMYRFSKQVGQ